MLFNIDKSLFLLIYVDDLLLLREPHHIRSATVLLQKKFTLTRSDIHSTVDFLGSSISRNSAGEYQLS